MNQGRFVDDEEAVVEFVGGLDREFGRCSQCRWRAGSIHEKSGGAVMRREGFRQGVGFLSCRV